MRQLRVITATVCIYGCADGTGRCVAFLVGCSSHGDMQAAGQRFNCVSSRVKCLRENGSADDCIGILMILMVLECGFPVAL